jgi:hypothetical protein
MHGDPERATDSLQEEIKTWTDSIFVILDKLNQFWTGLPRGPVKTLSYWFNFATEGNRNVLGIEAS